MNIAAIEAFARGAMSALLAGESARPVPQTKRTRRRRTAPTTATPPPEQMELQIAPGAVPEMPAPPVTQAQMEAIDRVLRGEQPAGTYRPTEGEAPWMRS